MMSIRLNSKASSFKAGMRFFAFCFLRFSRSSSVVELSHRFLRPAAATGFFSNSYLIVIRVTPIIRNN